jgi:hypothetical protein
VQLLGGALLLVSLYLPWQRVSVNPSEFGDLPGSVESLLQFFRGQETLDGWESGVAPAAALAALLLVALSAVALARPELSTRLPLGRVAVAAAYFGIAVAVDSRSRGKFLISGAESAADLEFAYGAYIGLGAVAAVLLATVVLRQPELHLLRSPLAVAAVIVAAGLLLVFLLPWRRFMGIEYTGIAAPAAQVGAVMAICTPRASRGLGLLVALFTAAAFSTAPFPFEHTRSAWIGLGLSLTLAALALIGGISRPALERIPWLQLVLGAAGLLLVPSFFLPWQEFCYPREAFGPTSGRCVSVNAWESEAGSGAALLAIALIMSELARRRRLPPRLELAAGIALLATTLGFQLGRGGPFGLGYGFWIGAACTAVIVLLAAAHVRPPPLDTRLAPIALCLVYLAVVVPAPTWWNLFLFDAPRFLWFAPFSWITVAGALLALTLIRLWLERPADTRQLFLVPAVIATLAGLDLARFETITWGGGIVLALCGLLALCAFVEQRGGLGELRIPEILRVDRL